MPCYDPRDHEPREVEVEMRHNGLKGSELEAVLCGVLNVDRSAVARLRPDVMLWDLVDWEEVGVPRVRVERWWERHKREDVLRRKREDAAKERTNHRLNGLKKLTVDERKALGLL